MFYSIDEVKNAVDQGFIVKWSNDSYTVIKDNIGKYLINYADRNYVGLTNDYPASQFYIVGENK